MSETKSFRDQWYVVQVLSGQEGKVRDRIARNAEAEGMTEYIREVLVPTDMVSEIRRGKTTETKKKFFPGYIIVNMHLKRPPDRLSLGRVVSVDKLAKVLLFGNHISHYLG